MVILLAAYNSPFAHSLKNYTQESCHSELIVGQLSIETNKMRKLDAHNAGSYAGFIVTVTVEIPPSPQTVMGDDIDWLVRG